MVGHSLCKPGNIVSLKGFLNVVSHHKRIPVPRQGGNASMTKRDVNGIWGWIECGMKVWSSVGFNLFLCVCVCAVLSVVYFAVCVNVLCSLVVVIVVVKPFFIYSLGAVQITLT